MKIYLVEARRTAIGRFGGALASVSPEQMGVLVCRGLLHEVARKRRIQATPEDEAATDATKQEAETLARATDHVCLGTVLPTRGRDLYLARVIALGAGLPETSGAFSVNRLCGSGLQAAVSAIHLLRLGEAAMVLAVGVESMSQAGYLLPALRWGERLGNTEAQDLLLAALTDPFGAGPMGKTAENLAQLYKISRETQDRLALQSHQRATRALASGFFESQIEPISVTGRMTGRKGQTTLFSRDEHVRSDITAEALAHLPPLFPGGEPAPEAEAAACVTAGNASGVNDGAAAVLFASESAVRHHRLVPAAEVVSYGYGGVAPEHMGLGPIPATRQALARAGLALADIDLIESNEAFAAQACAVAEALRFDPEKTNVNGGAIALGHPIGATGAILLTKLVHELRRRAPGGGNYGMVTLCIGGGQGLTLIVKTCGAGF